MPRIITLLVFLVSVSIAIAAPREKQPSTEALAAGDRFALEFGIIAQTIASEYVRPISTADLYQAAIVALHDACRKPRPETILRELRSAKDESERSGVVKRARAKLHGTPVLEHGHDLEVAVTAFTSVLDPFSLLLPSGILNGTSTSNIYGFEFEGEAQAVRPTARTGRDRLEPDWNFNPFRDGVPPVPFNVLFVKPGSPAQRAGLRPGDIVRWINGIPADSATAAKAFAALHGEGADKADPGVHQLVIHRAGQDDEIKLRLERTEFIPESLFGVTRKGDNSWDYWLDRDARIAYVRLGAIESDSGDRLQEILHDLRDVRGLVFDLRWCPGGYIEAATEIASTFLEEGVIARMTYRNPQRGENTTIHADGGLIKYKAGDYPVIVLVNGETIGGGELIAAALKDNGRAVLAGSRTYGKATIQWPVTLASLPGYSFKLTGGTYTRPNGKSLQRFPDSKPTDDWGLPPDPGFEIPMSADLAKKLKVLHVLYALRPGGSREAMDLDDPLADPQRARATKLVRKLIAEKAKKEQ